MDLPESPEPAPRAERTKGPIRTLLRSNRDFRLLFLAMLVSFAGDWFLFVALAGLVFELTRSPALVAALYFPLTIPFALFSFVGGPLADRLNRQRLMVGADVLRAFLALGYFLIDRPSEVWLAFVLTGGISALSAPSLPLPRRPSPTWWTGSIWRRPTSWARRCGGRCSRWGPRWAGWLSPPSDGRPATPPTPPRSSSPPCS